MSLLRLCTIASLAALLFAAPLNANEEEAALIEKLEARIALERNIRGSFQQNKSISVLPDPLQSHGRFTYDHDAGLVWETVAPIPNRLEFDKRGIRQSVDGEMVWEIGARQPAVVTITQVITSVLAADWASLREYFAIEGQVDEAGWQLQLRPRDEVLKQVVASISVSGDRVLKAMTLQESNGDRSEITFSIQETPSPDNNE